MRAQDFNFEKYLAFKEEKDKSYTRFLENKYNEVPIIQMASGEHWSGLCRYKEESLEAQLDFLTDSMSLKTDFIFGYLEPWYGVGIYAAAYGCKYIWYGNDAPQVLPVINKIDELKDFKHPSIYDCEEMLAVLDILKYFKDKTGGVLDISLTDTQSTNDTASLIMSTEEFFGASAEEPEILDPFLTSITKLIIDFSECQMEAIGDCLAAPGHIMVSLRGGKGISISDDNMSFLSPTVYARTSLKYNDMISDHFGGIAVHSCGNIGHNLELLRDSKGIQIADLAVGNIPDPSPCDAAQVAKIFHNSQVIVKAKVGWNEIEKIAPLVSPEIRLIVQLATSGSVEERNCQYESAREEINNICSPA